MSSNDENGDNKGNEDRGGAAPPLRRELHKPNRGDQGDLSLEDIVVYSDEGGIVALQSGHDKILISSSPDSFVNDE